MRGGLGSKPFDGEGLPTKRKNLVERGVLKTYLLDSYSARKLGLPRPATPRARSATHPASARPIFTCSRAPILPRRLSAPSSSGLYVTELIGFGVNSVTGDYSRGAGGMWIEDGELAYPVQEITIAGNLKEMFKSIEMIGNDLAWRSSTVVAHSENLRDDDRGRMSPATRPQSPIAPRFSRARRASGPAAPGSARN